MNICPCAFIEIASCVVHIAPQEVQIQKDEEKNMEKASTKQEILERLKRELPYLQKRFGVRQIALYGSFARQDQKKKSDVDILVELSRISGTF